MDNGAPFEGYSYSRALDARILSDRISAIQVTTTYHGQGPLGTITQLPKSAELEICGDGFNERTIKVCCQNSFYFVFREDIEILPA